MSHPRFTSRALARRYLDLVTYHRRESQLLMQDCYEYTAAGFLPQADLLFQAAKQHARALRAIEAGDVARIGKAVFL